MLEEFMNVMTDESVNNIDSEELNKEVKNLIEGLEMFSNNPKLLTNAYTDIFTNDNVVYLVTRISQNPILCRHFPELYIQNENGESVINCQQNSPYHRYGVFRHILYTMEYVGKDNLKYSKHDLKILKWTMFLHDMGKPFVKITNAEGRDSFAGHDEASVQMAEEILNRFDFSEQDKKIILTLIKYHDRYLNEGELTQDNFEFLAQELENKKELFELLIEVKKADNKAKSIEVYNKFATVLPKYEEFAAGYFKDIVTEQDEIVPVEIEIEDVLAEDEIIGATSDELLVDLEEKKSVKKETNSKKTAQKRVSVEEFNAIYENILDDQDISYMYSAIVDMENSSVFGYESKVEEFDGISKEQLLLKAREEGKYDKIQQLLFVNTVTNGIKEKKDLNSYILVKMDIESFESYNNKNRIYDMMDKNNIIISFENYDESNAIDINNLCKDIAKKHGMVSLSNFEKSRFTLKELSNMNVDFVEYDINGENEEKNLNDLIKRCEKDAKKIILKNVNTKKDLLKAKGLNTSLVQGKALFDFAEKMEVTDYEVEKKLIS